MSLSPETTFRYVSHEHADDYLRLGWCPAEVNRPAFHDLYSVLMKWLCPCPVAEPGRGRG
jgi:hypothetical protein